jgi:hypothetical protein
MDPKKVALNYIKSGKFAIDLIATLPFDYIGELFAS